ncbi:f-box domain containing protein [Colletotrichum musicola]|uniref:F-box domain containing protein n=1 Tax=Colletotrichum musicola TaxID=2175873 RepID=A0A8H6IR63_9PEZI|nr:f-box domain containing protein [Colletotrichum musicola]
MILDHLEPHDCFLLSKAHRLLQWLAGKDFAEWQRLLQEATRPEKMTFLTGLARVRLDHWVCQRCERMHYAPGNSGEYFGTGGYFNRRNWDACLYAPTNIRRIFDEYTVYHSDVQLALKR